MAFTVILITFQIVVINFVLMVDFWFYCPRELKNLIVEYRNNCVLHTVNTDTLTTLLSLMCITILYPKLPGSFYSKLSLSTFSHCT